MSRGFSILLVLVLGFAGLAPVGYGAMPLSYSGRLTDASGKPLAGPVDLHVKFYRNDVGVGPTKTFTATTLADGVFQITLELSDAELYAVFDDGTQPVSIEVTAGTKVFPKQRFSYVPYALRLPVDPAYFAWDANGKLTLILAPGSGDMLASAYDGAGGTVPGMIDQAESALVANDAQLLGGQPPSYYRDAANLTGTIADARIPAGIMRDSEVNPNWDTAYADRLKWDGGPAGLDASAGRTSLGLGTIATQAANNVTITGGSISGSVFAADAISGDKVDGGTISNFASTGIDDNATATAVTIDASGRVGIGTTTIPAKLTIGGTAGTDGIQFPDGTLQTTAGIVPPGTLLPFAGPTAPAGFLLCDGSALSRTTYAALFAAIGTAWGSGDGSTTFNIPDLRGVFLRGVDGTKGLDPDKASRTASAAGGNTGNAVGSYQSDQLVAHNHTHGGPSWFYQAFGFTATGGMDRWGDAYNVTVTSSNTGGNETRPKNVNVQYIIKY